MRKAVKLLGSLVLLISVLTLYDLGKPAITGSASRFLPGTSPLPSAISIPTEDMPAPIVLFCPQDHCMENMVYLINASKRVHCALYDLDLEPVINALKQKDAPTVIDSDNYNSNLAFAKSDDGEGLMHNKFCIFDDKTVMTGSFNPTENDNYKNNNNMLVIFSPALAQNYEAEFQELWNGQFRKGETVRTPKVQVGKILFENYFCPEDDCEDRVAETIRAANESVHFMTFSFTSDAIGNAVKDRYWNNVSIKGVFEKSQNNDYTEYPKLLELGMNVTWDHNKKNMHHKVFIIDRKIVVTGSFNPTANGDKYNDENVVIIHNPAIAERFEEEFERVYG